MGINYLTINGKSSLDFEAWITGAGTFNAPAREVETISIPGRNGDLHIDQGRYSNVIITYPAFIAQDFVKNFDALKAYLMSQLGYQELEDTYNPEYYRRARYSGTLEPEMSQLNRVGEFNITFDCDPRRFLKVGKYPITMTQNGYIRNFTQFDALPLIRCYGTGTIYINGISISIPTANGYTDIDCETEEAYKGSTSCNGNIVLNDDKFLKLEAGENRIAMTGLTSVEITPRWWTT